MKKKNKINLVYIAIIFTIAGILLSRFNKGLAGALLGSAITLYAINFFQHFEIKKK